MNTTPEKTTTETPSMHTATTPRQMARAFRAQAHISKFSASVLETVLEALKMEFEEVMADRDRLSDENEKLKQKQRVRWNEVIEGCDVQAEKMAGEWNVHEKCTVKYAFQLGFKTGARYSINVSSHPVESDFGAAAPEGAKE